MRADGNVDVRCGHCGKTAVIEPVEGSEFRIQFTDDKHLVKFELPSGIYRLPAIVEDGGIEDLIVNPKPRSSSDYL